MSADTTACPACGGPRLLRHPAGLVMRHTSDCRLGNAEDATKVADADRLRRYGRIARPATPAERELLAAAGHELPPGAVTLVQVLTPAVIQRSWAGVDLDEDQR